MLWSSLLICHTFLLNKDIKRCKRKIIWFNPPYSKNVSTKVGNQFLKLINKHFPQYHKFYKLFNKNTVKISYSCMPKMENIINTHNKKIINPPKDNIARTCNCIRKHQCPLNEKCLINNVLYKASIIPNEEDPKTKIYYGVCKTASSADMRTIRKHSTTWNTKLIQNYQTNIGIQNFGNPQIIQPKF